jgi:hypothetical protein
MGLAGPWHAVTPAQRRRAARAVSQACPGLEVGLVTAGVPPCARPHGRFDCERRVEREGVMGAGLASDGRAGIDWQCLHPPPAPVQRLRSIVSRTIQHADLVSVLTTAHNTCLPLLTCRDLGYMM